MGPGGGGGRADGGVRENGPRGVAARARVWTDGSPAWEPCSSCEERKGTRRGGWRERGGGRKRRRVEGGGGGGGGDDDDGGGGGGATDAVEASTHPHEEGARWPKGWGGGRERKQRGRNSFADDPATCRIDWQLWPSDDVYFVVALSILPRRGVSALPFQCQRCNNPLLGQPSQPCRPRSLFFS